MANISPPNFNKLLGQFKQAGIQGIQIAANRNVVDIEKVLKVMEKAMKEQADITLNLLDDGKTVDTILDASAQKKYNSIMNNTLTAVASTIALNTTLKMGTQVLEALFQEDIAGGKGWVDMGSHPNFKNMTQRGGWVGEFIESNFFGLGGRDNKPISDLITEFNKQKIRVEIKSSSKAYDPGHATITVGGITSYTTNSGWVDQITTDNMAIVSIFFKMLIKMSNFVFFKAEVSPDDKRVRFPEIMLSMVLILLKLWTLLNDESSKIVQKHIKKKGWDKNKLSISVYVSSVLTDVGILHDVHKVAELYLRTVDLRVEMQKNDSLRKAVYAYLNSGEMR